MPLVHNQLSLYTSSIHGFVQVNSCDVISLGVIISYNESRKLMVLMIIGAFSSFPCRDWRCLWHQRRCLSSIGHPPGKKGLIEAGCWASMSSGTCKTKIVVKSHTFDDKFISEWNCKPHQCVNNVYIFKTTQVLINQDILIGVSKIMGRIEN